MSAPVDNCPECHGLGTIGGRECGVCLGDLVLLTSGATLPFAAEQDITHGHTKFVDHSGPFHQCSRCTARAERAS